MSDSDVEKTTTYPDQKVFDHGHGQVGIVDDHGADCELQRRLSTRHITMIALGSSIGMGLWLGSGSSLSSGGPAGIFLGYLLSGTMVWAVSHSIGEMAVMYPLPSAFVQWSNKFVDPACGFALGWAAVNTVLSFWTDAVPIAAWMSIFWVVIVLVNIGAVNFFAEIEVVCSMIKFGWIFVVIISGIVISAGGAPGHGPIGFRYWNQEPFINGFKGFLSVMPTCIFAMAGSENAGLVAAETANPRRSVPKAVGSIWLRLSLFYIMGSLIVTITVSPTNPDIFGGSGTNASPFVIAYREAALPALAHMMNAVIFISVVSTGSISGFGGSRTLYGLSQIGMAPCIMQKADSWGRPWYALAPTLIIGGALSYLNVSYSGATVFGWFSNLTSLFTLFGWGMICLSHIRMRHAWKVQGRDVAELPWKSWTWPWAAYWGLAWCVILIIAEFYLAVWPLGEKSSAEHFFSVYVSVIAIVIAYAGAKIYYRNRRWVDTGAIDLDAGRRFYKDQEIEYAEAKNKSWAKKAVGIVWN